MSDEIRCDVCGMTLGNGTTKELLDKGHIQLRERSKVIWLCGRECLERYVEEMI